MHSASATFYEVFGPRGIMDANGVFPSYHVFQSLAGFSRAAPVTSSDPQAVCGLMVIGGRQLRILLANLSDESKRVRLETAASQLELRLLDERNVVTSMCDPESFWWQPDQTLHGANGDL